MSRHAASSSKMAPRRAAHPEESARALSKLSAELRSSFGFTKTEAVVAALSARGLSYSEIAEQLRVSYNTVHTHTTAIHKKAGVPTTGRLMALIYRTERTLK